MPILNYTTKIAAHKTVGEIQAMLARAGARAISIEYDAEAQPFAVAFAIDVAGRTVHFRLPSRWQGVEQRLYKDDQVPRRFKTAAQARRIAWRIVKDWVAAQLAIIEAGVAELPEVFLPYAVNPRSNKTLYQELEGRNYCLTDQGGTQ